MQLMYSVDKLNAETDSWDQTMYINDELVSELTTSMLGRSGKGISLRLQN